jgi:hypothetical protein
MPTVLVLTSSVIRSGLLCVLHYHGFSLRIYLLLISNNERLGPDLLRASEQMRVEMAFKMLALSLVRD